MGGSRPGVRRASIALAMDFRARRLLVRERELSDSAAAEVMARAVGCAGDLAEALAAARLGLDSLPSAMHGLGATARHAGECVSTLHQDGPPPRALVYFELDPGSSGDRASAE